jgi:hypothetical protein
MSAQPHTDPPILRAHRPKAHPATDVATDDQTYQPDAQPGQQLCPYLDTQDTPGSSDKGRWIVGIVLGMALVAMLFSILATCVFPFVTEQLDHWNTGESRIWQHDFNVGHPGGTSHFVTQYYRNHILIIEFEENDPAISHTYVIPYQFTPPPPRQPIITLEVRDLTNNHTSDLLIWIEGQQLPLPFYNNGHTFQLDPPATKGA